MSDPVPIESRAGMPPHRLLTTLGGAGAIAGLLIVFVFQWTQPTIRPHKAAALRLAIHEVLHQPDRFDTLYVVDETLTRELAADQNPDTFEQVYVGYRNNEQVGVAIVSGEPGFQDVVRVIFGYDVANRTILGMKVLENKETPGLGDKIAKDSSFIVQFAGLQTPLVGVRPRDATEDLHEVDMITGATISSRTVIRIINNALLRFDPLLDSTNGSANE